MVSNEYKFEYELTDDNKLLEKYCNGQSVDEVLTILRAENTYKESHIIYFYKTHVINWFHAVKKTLNIIDFIDALYIYAKGGSGNYDSYYDKISLISTHEYLQPLKLKDFDRDNYKQIIPFIVYLYILYDNILKLEKLKFTDAKNYLLKLYVRLLTRYNFDLAYKEKWCIFIQYSIKNKNTLIFLIPKTDSGKEIHTYSKTLFKKEIKELNDAEYISFVLNLCYKYAKYLETLQKNIDDRKKLLNSYRDLINIKLADHIKEINADFKIDINIPDENFDNVQFLQQVEHILNGDEILGKDLIKPHMDKLKKILREIDDNLQLIFDIDDSKDNSNLINGIDTVISKLYDHFMQFDFISKLYGYNPPYTTPLTNFDMGAIYYIYQNPDYCAEEELGFDKEEIKIKIKSESDKTPMSTSKSNSVDKDGGNFINADFTYFSIKFILVIIVLLIFYTLYYNDISNIYI